MKLQKNTKNSKSQRQLQIGENIKRTMSEIFLRNDILTIPNSYITVLQADVSPDAKNVKIFIDIFGNKEIHDKIVKKLNEMAPHFRYELSKRIVLRTAPEIKFILDKNQDSFVLVEEIIAKESQKFSK